MWLRILALLFIASIAQGYPQKPDSLPFISEVSRALSKSLPDFGSPETYEWDLELIQFFASRASALPGSLRTEYLDVLGSVRMEHRSVSQLQKLLHGETEGFVDSSCNHRKIFVWIKPTLSRYSIRVLLVHEMRHVEQVLLHRRSGFMAFVVGPTIWNKKLKFEEEAFGDNYDYFRRVAVALDNGIYDLDLTSVETAMLANSRKTYIEDHLRGYRVANAIQNSKLGLHRISWTGLTLAVGWMCSNFFGGG